VLLQISGESSPAFSGLVRVRVFLPFMKRLDSSPDSSPKLGKKRLLQNKKFYKTRKMTNLGLVS
jgi:hypothetical protein